MRLAALGTALCLTAAAQLPFDHIVIWMQENRAADHYYGTVAGWRGYGDRAATALPGGLNVFHQPVSKTNTSNYQLPWHVDTLTTSGTCMDAPAMDYITDLGMWHEGRMDAWCTARSAGMGMGHFSRTDLPYYFSLIDGFTIADAYHQSTLTQTNPNRLHLFSGCNGNAAGYPPVLDNSEPKPGFLWETMAETLENAGVSWKVYQQSDNFDDNGFEWFKIFQDAKPGSVWYDQGKAIVPDLVAAFENDVAAGTLPQVSWIVGPTALSEHATNHPAAGEDLSARLFAVLAAYPDVYAKTVMILNYDEGGQFFDHVFPPIPPLTAADGVSTVSTKEELYNSLPMGPGFRVPAIFISPWSRGPYVVSEVFDHTSVIQFIEKRWNVTCPNISPWRRAMCGDLTSAFDWEHPDYSWPTNLPDTSGYPSEANKECNTLPRPTPPKVQAMPTQEPGVRASRPLPYTFIVSDVPSSSTLTLNISNTGKAGGSFQLYNRLQDTLAPRKYGVEAGKAISDPRPISGPYNFHLHGPSGFVRTFSGSTSAGTTTCAPSASLVYDASGSAVTVVMTNLAPAGSDSCAFIVTDNAYGTGGPYSVGVAPGATKSQTVDVSASGNWYDLTAAVASASGFARRCMGRLENGKPTTSDPATTNPLHPFAGAEHPILDPAHQSYEPVRNPGHKDAMHFEQEL